MLVWMTLLTGLVVLVVGSVLMTRVDRRWKPLHQRCSRCEQSWFGRGTFCGRCGARGRAHDWRADTDPLPADDATVGLDLGTLPDRFGRFEPRPLPRTTLPAPREPLEHGVARRTA